MNNTVFTNEEWNLSMLDYVNTYYEQLQELDEIEDMLRVIPSISSKSFYYKEDSEYVLLSEESVMEQLEKKKAYLVDQIANKRSIIEKSKDWIPGPCSCLM